MAGMSGMADFANSTIEHYPDLGPHFSGQPRLMSLPPPHTHTHMWDKVEKSCAWPSTDDVSLASAFIRFFFLARNVIFFLNKRLKTGKESLSRVVPRNLAEQIARALFKKDILQEKMEK